MLVNGRIFIPATVSANRVPTLSSSGEKQIWSEPEDHQPRSSDKVQLSRRKRLVGGGLNRLQGESSDYDKEIYNYENDRVNKLLFRILINKSDISCQRLFGELK
ncbi:hypothetical protein DY000_02033836 [Brassica cretica]|uniref:Uncharacterized protein n=1 Tax=Brassica cretica TaxID=69181 RepID=A0ABQ7DWL4_BRACR|nr:hypothetical protein DY000_02033836 [Brassica cretica]